jgi:hypothetical protein
MSKPYYSILLGLKSLRVLLQLNVLIPTLRYIIFCKEGSISKYLSLPDLHKWMEVLVSIDKLISYVFSQLKSSFVIQAKKNVALKDNI